MYKILTLTYIFSALSSCSLNNAEEDPTLEKYFKQNNLTGTFGLFDNGTGKFTMHNMRRYTDSTYLPFSTYNIIKALIGLETGSIKDSLQLINTDSISLSVSQDTVNHYLDTLGYNTSKITADEQLGLVKKLYFSQLPFQPRTQRIVKNMLKKEDNANYILSYQTGDGTLANGRSLGWLIGWIEENKHPYFFVLQIEANGARDLKDVKVKILGDILKQYGFMEGKR